MIMVHITIRVTVNHICQDVQLKTTLIAMVIEESGIEIKNKCKYYQQEKEKFNFNCFKVYIHKNFKGSSLKLSRYLNFTKYYRQ